MTSPAERIIHSATLSRRDVDQVERLAARVEAADGAPPLDEQASLRLHRHVDGVEHVLLRAADEMLLGYAQLDAAGPTTAEVVVGVYGDRPAIASTLFDVAQAASTHTGLLVWARGDDSPVRAEADARGYVAARGLLSMARPLADLDAGPTTLPGGATIRPFVPGRDDADWLRVNAAAFASHPEQGRWTQADLEDRTAQDWFDPNGFLLLVDADGSLLGFHWTKLHPPITPGGPPVGEVYVLGLDPSAQGRKLSRPLLVAGLAYLQHTGADTVVLYVDEENTGAVRLYERAGFDITRRQTQYRRET